MDVSKRENVTYYELNVLKKILHNFKQAKTNTIPNVVYKIKRQ